MTGYDFYLTIYGGESVPIGEWEFYSKRAQEQLNRYKRIYRVTAPAAESESMAVCAMADALAYFSAVLSGTGGAVSSASIGSVSVSYGGASDVDLSPKAQEKELLRCASQYLDIYRGVG